jgi:hypothetical protein
MVAKGNLVKRNSIEEIVFHISDDMDFNALSDKINGFHVNLIEQKLRNSDFIMEEKVAVVNQISQQLKIRERNGRIIS